MSGVIEVPRQPKALGHLAWDFDICDFMALKLCAYSRREGRVSICSLQNQSLFKQKGQSMNFVQVPGLSLS